MKRLMLLTMFLASFSYGKAYQISTFNEDSVTLEICQYIMERVYQKAGHEMKIIRVPGKRSLIQADTGKVAGELCRTRAVEKKHSNLVAVPFAVSQIKLVAFSKKDVSKVRAIRQLSQDSLGQLRGIVITERLLMNRDSFIVGSIQALFKMLLLDRFDHALFLKNEGILYLQNNNLLHLINYSPVLALLDMFHFINKDQTELFSSIEATLSSMSKSGELDQLMLEAEQVALSKD